MSSWWDRPVRVMVGNSMAVNVTNSERAAEVLLNEWPTSGGSRHLAAREAVLKALEHAMDSKARLDARKAFEAAAEEADILVPPPTKPPVPPGFKSPSWGRRR